MTRGSTAADTPAEYAPTRDELEQLLSIDPAAARRDAEQILASEPSDSDIEALALRIAGSADRELGKLVRARRRLERAAEIKGVSDEERALAQAALVPVLLLRGEFDSAWQISEIALEQRDKRAVARLRLARSAILSHRGDSSGALSEVEMAIALGEKLGDRDVLQRALNNRAIVRASLGRYSAAINDLERLSGPHAGGGAHQRAITQHNLGLMVASSGEIPRGLRLLEEADAALDDLRLPHPEGHLDHAQLLLEVGLLPESLTHAERGRAELEARGWASGLPDAHHLLARVALASDNGAAAQSEVAAELDLLRTQNRPTAAAIALGQAAAELSDDGREQEDRPAVSDLPSDLLLRRARRYIVQNPALSTEALEEIIVRNDRSSWRARTEVLVARAELRFMGGDVRGTREALAAVYQELDANRWWLGVGEICSAALRSLDSMIDLTGRLALATNDPDDLVRGYENARQLNRSAPAVDRDTTALASRARGLSTRLGEPDLSDRQKADLLRRLRSTRAQLRRRSWGRGAEPGRTLRAIEPPEISSSFEQTAGLILAEVGGDIVACSMKGASRELIRIADAASVAPARRALSGAHLALLKGRAEAEKRFKTVIDEIDERILAPLAGSLGDQEPIVMSVADELLSLPWGTMPTLRGRALSLVPSLSWWCHVASSQEPPIQGRTVLVAGPDLDHAEHEIDLLRAHQYPDATVLAGSDATAQAFIDACEEADLVHVAAHGRFRDDSPMFSSIELADGPLSVFELGQVAEPPRQLVLSTCDLGRHGATPMARASGLVHLLGSGWRSIAASTTAVLDTEAPQTMNRLHSLLADTSLPAAVALLNSELPLGQASLVAFGR